MKGMHLATSLLFVALTSTPAFADIEINGDLENYRTLGPEQPAVQEYCQQIVIGNLQPNLPHRVGGITASCVVITVRPGAMGQAMPLNSAPTQAPRRPSTADQARRIREDARAMRDRNN